MVDSDGKVRMIVRFGKDNKNWTFLTITANYYFIWWEVCDCIWQWHTFLGGIRIDIRGTIKINGTFVTYKRTAEKADIWQHRPDNRCQVRYVQQSRSVPLDEKGNYRIAKEVKDNEAQIIKHYSCCVAWLGISERFVLFENYERFKGRENAAEEAKEAKVIIDVSSLFD